MDLKNNSTLGDASNLGLNWMMGSPLERMGRFEEHECALKVDEIKISEWMHILKIELLRKGVK